MHTWNAFDQATHTLPAPRGRPTVETIYPVALPSPDTDGDTTTTRRPGRMRTAFASWREVRRINRAYRRERREFDRAVDAVSASPGAQQELHSIWARR